MTSWLLPSLVLVVALVQFGTCVVPAKCPNLNTNTCFSSAGYPMVAPNANVDSFAIGGIFNIRTKGKYAFECGDDFNPDGILHSQAFLWSVNYWRNRQPAGTSISVGAVVFDSCDRQDQMIQNILGFEQCNIRFSNIDRHDLVGFVGPTSNMDAMVAAELTEDMDLILISPLANSPKLADFGKYPYFLRTTPSLEVDVDALVSMLDKINAGYVAAFYEESMMPLFDLFKSKLTRNDPCLVASYAMPSNVTDNSAIDSLINNQLKQLKKTRYIALFLSPMSAEKFITRVTADTEAATMGFVFLMTSDIRQNSGVFSSGNALTVSDSLVLERQIPASVQVAVNAFETYWNSLTLQSASSATNPIDDPLLKQYLAAGNSLPAFNADAAFTIMATKAIIDGVRSAGTQLCSNQLSYLCTNFFDSASRGSDIRKSIRESGFFSQEKDSKNHFLNGDLKADTVVYNVMRFRVGGTFDKVGEYKNGVYTEDLALGTLPEYSSGKCHVSPCLPCGEQTTTTSTTMAPTTTTIPVCKPKYEGNYSIVYYPPGQEVTGAYMQKKRGDEEYATRFEIGRRWIIALGVLAGVGILAVIVFEIYILYKLLGTQMGQKWRTMWLGQLLLFGIFLCYLTLFAYIPIPTKATCGITRFGVGVSYSICFAVLLVKLMVILTSKSTDNSLIPGDAESPNYLKGIYQFLMFVFVVGVQVVIDTQWLITVPPEAVKVISNNGDEVWVCNHYTFRASGSPDAMTDMPSFVRNEFENHIMSLVYIMFLILITTLVALNAHGIITNHRESVFIGIAAGFSIPIWLAWTLVGGLNRDHDYAQEFGDACLAFGLFLTATLILFAMFLPKVRQLVNMGVEGIYFEDDRDTYYAGSVIMAPPSYKSRPNSVIYVNNQGIYSEPVVVGNGDTGSSFTHLRHPGSSNPTPGSTYSAPPTYLKKGADSTIRGGSVLRVTDDLSGRRPIEKKRPMSEVAYGTASSRPRSHRGTLPRSRSQTNLGAL